ncbi:zinc ribbon domain-containing protein [Variovorax sp. H27-G14]|uniref:zinc ribbon domain-containing protein n=1 Tax=Variovorax sp. H27-G14 TaxID=3111914 RepID=UPI0038FC8691
MALICPDCNTENRDGAHFCRHCGSTLTAAADRIPPAPSPEREWATTAPAQLRAPTIPAPLFDPAPAPAPARSSPPVRSPARSFFGRASAAPRDDEQTVFMVHDDDDGYDDPPHLPAPRPVSPTFESEHAAKAERGMARASARRPVPLERPPRKRVILLWLGLLGIAVAMLVAGWYGYGTRKTPVAADETVQPAQLPAPAASAAPAAAPAVPAVEAAAALPPAAQSAEPAEAPAAADTTSAAAAAASSTAKPAAKPPRKQTTVAAPAPTAPEPVAPVVAAAPPPPAPAAPAEPQAQCNDRNFIAKAQCMASQCLKAEFKSHAQCDAVRRQQRLEEEKRNPTLVN